MLSVSVDSVTSATTEERLTTLATAMSKDNRICPRKLAVAHRKSPVPFSDWPKADDSFIQSNSHQGSQRKQVARRHDRSFFVATPCLRSTVFAERRINRQHKCPIIVITTGRWNRVELHLITVSFVQVKRQSGSRCNLTNCLIATQLLTWAVNGHHIVQRQKEGSSMTRLSL